MKIASANITLAAVLALSTLTAASQATSGNRAVTPSASANSNGAVASQMTKYKYAPLKLILTCGVYGTPTEFPGDIRIWEQNGNNVPAGTKVYWKVPGSTFHGIATLPAIAAGKFHTLNNVLLGGYPAGPNCQISQF